MNMGITVISYTLKDIRDDNVRYQLFGSKYFYSKKMWFKFVMLRLLLIMWLGISGSIRNG